MEIRQLSLLCFCICSIHGLPQFGFPFSRFSDFNLPQIPSFDSDDFALPEAGLRMALPSVDGAKVNKTTNKKKLKGKNSLKILKLPNIFEEGYYLCFDPNEIFRTFFR